MPARHRVLVLSSTALLLGGCGAGEKSAPSSQARQDSAGDPIISDQQGSSIRVGEPAAEAFAALGGRAPNGLNGGEAPGPRSFDYPIRGTGNPNAIPEDGKTLWWQLCIGSNERVTSTRRAHLSDLTACNGS